MRHLEKLSSQFSISIPCDDDGLMGRECPVSECEGYFKIQPGTGLKGEGLPCHCPYCGHEDEMAKFHTRAQVEYAKSMVLNKVTGAIIKDLKSMEFNHRPKGGFGIGISMKVSGRPMPIRYYREKQLETEVVCTQCSLRYMIYGVFGYCPDCGTHNTVQILNANLQLIEKVLGVADVQELNVAQSLIQNGLEDCVSAFDGFGRELCRVRAKMASEPAKAAKLSFQNLEGARKNLLALFNIKLDENLTEGEWNAAVRSFQKRHLFSHKMGVADDDYVHKSGDLKAVAGRKIGVDANEVRELIRIIEKLGKSLSDSMAHEDGV